MTTDVGKPGDVLPFKKPGMPKAFGMATFDPKEVHDLFGQATFLFNYSPSHLAMMSFWFGWTDVIVFARFGFFGTFQTGNLIFACILGIPRGNVAWIFNVLIEDPGVLVAVVVSHAILGGMLACMCFEFIKDRTRVYGVLITLCCIMCIVSDVLTGKCYENGASIASPYLICPFIITLGGLHYWTSKLAYLVNLHTFNLMRLTQASYLMLRGYSVGTKKLRGDLLCMIIMVCCFVIGVLCGAAFNSEYYQSGWTLTPMAVMLPFMLHSGGCSPESWNIAAYLFNALELYAGDGEGQLNHSPSSETLTQTDSIPNPIPMDDARSLDGTPDSPGRATQAGDNNTRARKSSTYATGRASTMDNRISTSRQRAGTVGRARGKSVLSVFKLTEAEKDNEEEELMTFLGFAGPGPAPVPDEMFVMPRGNGAYAQFLASKTESSSNKNVADKV